MADIKILVAFDGSEVSEKALQLAIDIADPNPEASIDVVYVTPIPILPDLEAQNLEEIINLMVSDGEELLYRAQDILGDLTDRSGTLLVKGSEPAAEILKLIEAGSYSLVVLGNRGRGGIRGYLGSVSHKVLHGSSIPVTIVK